MTHCYYPTVLILRVCLHGRFRPALLRHRSRLNLDRFEQESPSQQRRAPPQHPPPPSKTRESSIRMRISGGKDVKTRLPGRRCRICEQS